jgi:hypothetical protein
MMNFNMFSEALPVLKVNFSSRMWVITGEPDGVLIWFCTKYAIIDYGNLWNINIPPPQSAFQLLSPSEHGATWETRRADD